MITTCRLLLREFEDADWKLVHEFASDPQTVNFVAWGPNTEAQTKNFIAACRKDQALEPRLNYEMAIVFDAKVIGGIGLNISESDLRSADLGYCLNRKYWGQKLAQEACSAIIAYGFATLGLDLITATCDPENAASIAILERLSFKIEREVKHDLQIRGQWRDSLYFSLRPNTAWLTFSSASSSS